MQYLLMIYTDEAAMQRQSPADVDRMQSAYGAYTQALIQAGVMKGGERLKPSSLGTTVRVTDAKTAVLNGPYAESKEQLAGFYLIDVPDLDAALAWAARCPGASFGVMEVRPIWAMDH